MAEESIVRFGEPGRLPRELEVEVPGSKSITNRAFLLSALADGQSTLLGVGFGDDTRHFLGSLESLGFPVEIFERERVVKLTGFAGGIPNKKATIDVGSAGTAARFLTPLLFFADGEYLVDASHQMRARPMKQLLDAMTSIGGRVEFLEEEGFLPFRVHGAGFRGGKVVLPPAPTSQYLSGVLMTAVCCPEDVEIRMQGDVPTPSYVEMTLRMMEDRGVQPEQGPSGEFIIRGDQKYASGKYQIEPDVSGACYFYAMAALTGSSVLVKNVRSDSLQGDISFLKVLESLGCLLSEDACGITVHGCKDGVYPGVTVDMNDFSDQALTLAALAPFASSPTEIRNISHVRHQECDRISAMATELTRMGIVCEEFPDGIRIHPGVPKPIDVETYGDHRVAMAFSLISLRVAGIGIKDPECTRKTFEGFFDLLGRLQRGQAVPAPAVGG